jgi:hypothetical protein
MILVRYHAMRDGTLRDTSSTDGERSFGSRSRSSKEVGSAPAGCVLREGGSLWEHPAPSPGVSGDPALLATDTWCVVSGQP